MKSSGLVRGGLVPGALAGVAGGLVFGAAMADYGALPTIASIVRAQSVVAGFAVHMLIAAVIGAGFGLVVYPLRSGVGETLLWGLAYGGLWWFLGPLTLLPLLLGEPATWTVEAARAAFPSLLGHILYGATAALALSALSARSSDERPALRPSAGPLLRGAGAGLIAALLFAVALGAPSRLAALMPAAAVGSLWAWLATGLAFGIGYGLLYPRLTGSPGAALTRGMTYGFVWWVVVALTLVPLVDGAGLAWSLDAARGEFAAFPGCLLLGAAVGLLYRWLDGLRRLLFVQDVRAIEHESAGARGLRALGRGALGGLLGGLVFTVVMVQIGFLPTVAQLVGSSSVGVGLAIHLLIADLIGASYGLLFRRQSFDVGSALGWGVAYGLLWWLLGPLTLLPILLGAPPQWTLAGAAATFPSLVGHLAYGAALGVAFYRLEARYSPWWLTRNEIEAERAERRREQVFGSAPALWAVIAMFAVTVPLLLGQ